MKKVGLIVNPVAGLGGSVGLKGSDGEEVQRRAIALGARPEAGRRAAGALAPLVKIREKLILIVCAGEMGEEACKEAGLDPDLVLPVAGCGSLDSHLSLGGRGGTAPGDTVEAAKRMKEEGVDLLLFAGGDGTARNVFEAVGAGLTVLGIPAGVKIHSGVFALNPQSAGAAALQFLREERPVVQEAEVMDLDEEAYRQGQVCPKLYGYLTIPHNQRRIQNVKARSSSGEGELTSIAAQVIDDMEKDVYYIIGAGTTTRRIMECLKLPNTLIGIDVIRNKELVASDVTESQLWDILQKGDCRLILTVIGGQGHVFGRGNQQISPRIIRRLGVERIQLAAAKRKLLSLPGRRLTVDTGDPLLDEELKGCWRVTVGAGEQMICRMEL